MLIKIPYGKDGAMDVTLQDKFVGGIVNPNKVPAGDAFQIIEDAVSNPVNSKNLQDFLKGSGDVLFIVNDATRPTPTAKVLDIIYDDIKDYNIRFIVATGIHRAPTEEEYHQIFGKHYLEFKNVIFAHDSKDEKNMVYLGKSKNGTEMVVNRMGVEADKIVIIGSVEPHYFAGYTGGRKSFLPGIASYKTIEQNHKMALSPKAKSLALDGNPVHEDMIDALQVVKKDIFAIMTILDMNHNLYAATSGDINDSFYKAIDKANDVFVVPIKEKADIVVSVAKFPMDIDLYQSQKAIDNAKLALKNDGIIILVSKCRSGVGHDSFVNLMGSCDSPKEVLEKIEREYVIGYHKAAKMAEIGLWAQTWGVTDLPHDVLEKVFIRPFDTIQDAVDNAIKLKGEDAKVLFMMDGSVTVPM
ncbi:nickel-dependent lactate racemase, partial [bacterium]|nr:nickel-dependent lactate racemase [bacterium]